LSIAFIDVYLDNKIMEAALMLNDNKEMPLSGNETFFSEKTIYYPTGEVESITESFSTDENSEIVATPPEEITAQIEPSPAPETEINNEENSEEQSVEIPNDATIITEEDLGLPTETETNQSNQEQTVLETSIEPILIDGEIDVEKLLSKIEFTEKLFLGKVLIKIGGMETVEKLIKGDTAAYKTVQRKLSLEEQEQLVSLFNKYKNYIGNITN
jgi:hypothetical protein